MTRSGFATLSHVRKRGFPALPNMQNQLFDVVAFCRFWTVVNTGALLNRNGGRVEGYVYIISNKAMPDLVKVGFTTRSPEERAAELSGTSLPFPSVAEYSVIVSNAAAVEREAHRRLAQFRVSSDREWFQCSRAKAIAAIKASAGSVVRQEKDRAVEEERRRAAQEESLRNYELRRQGALAAKARAEAHEAARQVIFKKYDPQLEALARVPHFFVFWLMGGASVSLVMLFALPASKEPSTAFFVICFLMGAIPGFVFQELAQERKKRSKDYVDLEAERNAELDSLKNRPFRTSPESASKSTGAPQRPSSTSDVKPTTVSTNPSAAAPQPAVSARASTVSGRPTVVGAEISEVNTKPAVVSGRIVTGYLRD